MRIITNAQLDAELLHFKGKQESQWIEPASRWTDDVIARVNGNIAVRGDLMPWSKTHNCIKLRPGEVSLWGGINGHGKSMLLNQVCAWNLPVKNWLIASLEMKPAATMQRMCRQVIGTNQPSDEYIRKFMSWTDDKLWIYDQTDTVDSDRILAMVYYAAHDLEINHIIIDSLVKCGLGRADTHATSNAQAAFIDRLCWAAKTTNCHIHVVHHMRKGQDEYHEPDKMDFRGAGEITDLVDNVFIIHRNKRKEVRGEEAPDEPDCTLRCAKQRHGEFEGAFKLWFHAASQQFIPDSYNRVMPYPELK